MKKKKRILLVLFVFIGLLFLFSFLLPNPQEVSVSVNIQQRIPPVERMMKDFRNWKYWLPENVANDSTIIFLEQPLEIDQIYLTGFSAHFVQDKGVTCDLHFVPSEGYTVNMTLIVRGLDRSNILTRIPYYLKYRRMNQKMTKWLDKVKAFFEDEEQLYGSKIVETKVKDPDLISIKSVFTSMPATLELYEMIDSLKMYVAQQNAKTTNFPIMHVQAMGESRYEAMVSIATDRALPASGRFLPKKMILGNILEVEVKGGPSRVQQKQEMLELYLREQNRTSPAIPYQMLVTDRRTEPDTAKWITKIYYPIFERL